MERGKVLRHRDTTSRSVGRTWVEPGEGPMEDTALAAAHTKGSSSCGGRNLLTETDVASYQGPATLDLGCHKLLGVLFLSA